LAAAKVKIQAAAVKNPQRFRDRREPKVDTPLGAPPPWVVDVPTNMARTAWTTIGAETPWLNSSHRSLVGIAASILGRQIAGQDVGVQAMNLLRQCLSQMGATPVDASKIAMPDDRDEDAEESYFNRPN